MFTIKLQYFKPHGKYYSSGEFQTALDPRKGDWKIMDELRARRAAGTWDGLVGPCPYFHTLVLIPFLDGTDDHMPHLIPAPNPELWK